MVERYDETLYLRMIDIYIGQYELTWRVAPDSHQPMSVETATIFISEMGNISGEFKCEVSLPITREKYSKGYGLANCKCIIEDKFLDNKNKKMKIYYELIRSDETPIAEGWRNGRKR
jgi:hypothetical protein